MAGPETQSSIPCHKLGSICGFDGKQNDVLFCGSETQPPEANVIFFGGDIQNYKDDMNKCQEGKDHHAWNLEATAQLLHKRFPKGHIFVVKPCDMYLHIFSIFSNFVESNQVGAPDHIVGGTSWKHLKLLLDGSRSQLRDPTPGSSNDRDPPVYVIGFSKGCVVLNQLLYDYKVALLSTDTANFVNSVTRMYWLDGGHSGGSNTWITDDIVLDSLKDTKMRFFTHVTPYQVKDEMRHWVGKEHERFIEKLRDRGVDVTNVLHFANSPRDIQKHFQVLTKF